MYKKMLSIGLLTLALLVSGVLIALGFYFSKRALLLSLTGSLVLVIVGIIVLGQGINFPSGETATVVGNVTTTISNSVNTQDTTTEILGWVFTILGFAGFIGSAMGLNKLRFEDDEIDDYVTDKGRF